MNIKNYFIKIIALFTIIFLLAAQSSFIFAATKTELQNEKSDVQEKIDATNSEIAGVKSKMTTQLNEINRLNTQMSQYESEIEGLEAQQSVLEKQIKEKEDVINEKQKQYDENEQLLEKRLVAMYKQGRTSYLDVLFSSKDLSDFISKYYLIAKLTDYDHTLLEKIMNEKNEIEEEKKSLESKKEELNSSIATLNTKREGLDVVTEQKKATVATLSAEEKELQEQLEQFEADKKAIEKELAAIAAAAAAAAKKNGVSTTPVAPSACGYVSPIPGRTKNNITTGFYGYSGHTGVDFAVAGGTPIVAVKDGTVITSKALKTSSGAYRSYGEYIVIDHHDGTMTLYAHGQPGSRKVSPNDTVKQGQTIMNVGTTGNSTGNHLHFEVRINGKPVNPTSYLP